MANIALPASVVLRDGATDAPPALVEALIEELIGALDAADGDLDLEPNGDELDGSTAEDEFVVHGQSIGGPGCPFADPSDRTLPEWHTLPARDRRAEVAMGRMMGGRWSDHEDDEEDDGPDSSGDEAEPDFRARIRGYGPGCQISDSDYGGEEAGERDEIAVPIYGRDQTTGPINGICAPAANRDCGR